MTAPPVPLAPSRAAVPRGPDLPVGRAGRQHAWAALAAVVSYVLGGLAGALAAVTTTRGALGAAGSEHSAAAILVNNVGVLGWLGLGLLTAGIVPLAVLMFNGMLLGWVIGKTAVAGSLSAVATGVLPHLVPELAAYVLCASASTVLGVRLAARVLRGRALEARAWRTWWTLHGVAVLLLAVGALIERYVSHV